MFTTSYNPPEKGVCKKFNGTLKKMNAKVTDEHPNNWDIFLPAVLFAHREVPQHSTEFSPFKPVYGVNKRGPLKIYRELLTGKMEDPENRTNTEIITYLRDKRKTSCEEAREALKDAGVENRYYATKKGGKIELLPQEKILLLLPDKVDKLAVSWQGSYEVTGKISYVDYEIKINDKLKIYHINMLKSFSSRKTELEGEDSNSDRG